ncbi:radical SAM protein [Cyanobium sp. ATX 6A2]|uniref:radical SAM protein n=1 Tax=Cyanobium sp. ATX 6A2 TaxID=2823700 RepID=UPI0020CD69E1|nr:radical SAM protein [Cyanobium sp. ATX 6A2]MCP9889420.1 radical SAM protein [Cyanobium sp. ATX 6A2]
MNYKVMQIETSNFCSLTCSYCPHPGQKRPKGNMDLDTFKKCIKLVRQSCNPERDQRKFVWLNHFGEPLLNPLLPKFIEHATENGVEVSFASNGVDSTNTMFSRSLWQELADSGLRGVGISAHTRPPEDFTRHLDGILDILYFWEPKKGNFHDWAGQVDLPSWKVTQSDAAPQQPCDYEKEHMFAITWDGRIAACCYDIEAQTGLSIDDVIANGYLFEPISLCATCTLGRGDSSWLIPPITSSPATT